MLALVAFAVVLSLVECASLTPQEQAADTGQPVGILICAIVYLVGLTCVHLVFPSIADRLKERKGFNTSRFMGHVFIRVAIFALASSAGLHLLFGGSFVRSSSFEEFVRLLAQVSVLLAAFVSPFALLWRWLAK